MPNWVTNEVKAPAHVIAAMVNEAGHIDFNKLLPFKGTFGWDGVIMDAETLAEKVLDAPLDDHPLVGALQADSRKRSSIKNLTDDGFEQFIQMLRNHRSSGFMHQMDFARETWGTKWNACDQSMPAPGVARFDTAWSFPEPVILALSALFPEETIQVRYADEDIGSNCGTVTFRAGEIVEQDRVGDWNLMTEAEKAKWEAFAYEVKGWEPEPDAA